MPSAVTPTLQLLICRPSLNLPSTDSSYKQSTSSLCVWRISLSAVGQSRHPDSFETTVTVTLSNADRQTRWGRPAEAAFPPDALKSAFRQIRVNLLPNKP